MKLNDIQIDGFYLVDDLTVAYLYKSEYSNNIGGTIYVRPDAEHVIYRSTYTPIDSLANREVTFIQDINLSSVDEKSKIDFIHQKGTMVGVYFKDNNEYEEQQVTLFPKDIEAIKKAQEKKSTKIIKKFGNYHRYELTVINGILSVKSVQDVYGTGQYTQFIKPVNMGNNKLVIDYINKQYNYVTKQTYNIEKHFVFKLTIKEKQVTQIVDVNNNVLNINDKVAIADYTRKKMYVGVVIKLSEKRVTVNFDGNTHSYRYDQVCKIS